MSSSVLATLPSSGTTGQPEVPGWISVLARQDGVGLSQAAMIDAISELERLKAAAAAAQARLTVAYAAARRAQARPVLQTDPARLARVIGSEVALARRESPARGSRLVGLAEALVHDLPHTMTALSTGRISEWRATIITRETACLTRPDRLRVDRDLAPDLEALGDRRLGDRARALGYRLDPEAALRRTRHAEADRRVSIRPAPDTMVWLGALLPVAQGVAAYAALERDATSAHAAGDPRSRTQLMADLLTARLTGTEPSRSPAVELGLVMSERTLLEGNHEPAQLTGYGPLPAALARRLAREADRAWIRRLYTHPSTGELVAMESRRRTFTGRLRQLLILRDQTCRTPWCDAPIRHADHITPATDRGPTSAANGQGLCEHCNYTKTGWHADLSTGRGHLVQITTATGHRYHSQAPPLPGAPPRTAEEHLRRLLDDTG